MVEIFTSPERASAKYPDRKLLYMNDIYFNTRVLEEGLTETDKKYIARLDKVEFVPGGNILTRDGLVTSVTDISTGVKVIINILHLKNTTEWIMDATECGGNFLPLALDLADRFHVPVVLMHADILEIADKPRMVDGKVVDTELDLYEALIHGVK